MLLDGVSLVEIDGSNYLDFGNIKMPCISRKWVGGGQLISFEWDVWYHYISDVLSPMQCEQLKKISVLGRI